jgi:hypothetical protein
MIKVLGYLGKDAGYKLGDSFIIHNGDIDCEITFYIMDDALGYWSAKNLKGGNTDVALTKFYEQNFEKFKKILSAILGKLIQHFEGFPSKTNLAEKLVFCFDEFNDIASWKPLGKDYKAIGLWYNVNSLKISLSNIVSNVKHELFHVISEVHHGESNTRKRITPLQAKLEESIDKTRQTVDNGIQQLLVYCSQNRLEHKFNLEKILSSVGIFYVAYTDMFWNFINDSALGVIAIEIDDMEHIKFDVEKERRNLFKLTSKLKKINDLMAHTIKNEIDEKKRNFLLHTLELLQFMTCFQYMPYEAIAYGILGDDWRPKMKRHFARNLWKSWHKNKSSKNIEDFKKTVITYCKSDVAEGFLRFYDSYLHIIGAQAIHNNPLNPNITQQIHNTECLERGENAYRMLHEEFNKLFRELKKYE